MTYILEGNISVKAALQAKRRPVETLIVEEKKHDPDTRYILHLARERGVLIERYPRNRIDEMASGMTHGGMLALCGEREYQSLNTYRGRSVVFLALLEGIEDPFNFGYALRSLYATGCDGVIIPPRNWTSASGIVGKASGGACEYMDLIIANPIEDVLKELKDQGITLVCAQRSEHSCDVYTYTFPDKLCLAIGGEMRGLSKAVRSASDENIYIPYANDFRNAMTAASSSAILAFERLRQQKLK